MSSDRVSEEYLHGDLDGALAVYIEAVKTGSKPVASYVVLRRQAAHAIQLIEREGLQFLILPRSHERVLIFLFRHLYLPEVILTLEGPLGEILGKPFSVWACGEMFGYSEQDIAKCIQDMSQTSPSPL